MKFFDDVGKMALGTRVRFMGDKITAEAREIYRLYGTDLQPKWFPVFYALSKGQYTSGTAIAEHIGHSHASVSKILAEMAKAGLVRETTDAIDRRRTQLALSPIGLKVARKIKIQYQDVGAAIDELTAQATHNLWEALEEWEYLLNQKSLLDRVIQQKKQRQCSQVEIVPFQAKYTSAFRRLNQEWITAHFKMEKPDHDALDNPKKYILDKGGFIFVAIDHRAVVGVCALLPIPHQQGFELAKMAVSPKRRGQNIGYLLGQAVIAKAISLNAPKLYLESNTSLKPAISLYQKLGFKKIAGPTTPYERCNIQMELKL